MHRARIRYARSGEGQIAYQVVGQGSLDLVLVPGFPNNLEILAEEPGYGRLVKRLSGFGRLVLFDPRGTGLSDAPDRDAPDPDTVVDDIAAVLDAAGCGRAAVIGCSQGAEPALRFAAAAPQRVRALVLQGCCPRPPAPRRPDEGWGSGAALLRLVPGRAGDPAFADWCGRLERLAASPSAAQAQAQAWQDARQRPPLPRPAVPVLVLHRRDDPHSDPEQRRQLLAALPAARMVELAGADHPVWAGDVDDLADRIEEFLTGERPLARPSRVLAVALAVRVLGPAAGRAADGAGRHAGERLDLLQQALPRLVARHGGQCRWSAAERLDARFDGVARATGCAVAVREAAESLGLAVAQGLHVGEAEAAADALSGGPFDLAAQLAGASRRPEILLSRLASELVSGSGLQFVSRGTVASEGRSVEVVALSPERHLEPLARPKPPAADLAALSQREREVLSLVAEGLSNPHIAVRLGLSEHTVKRHVANILLKLDLPTRAAAAGLVARQP